MAERRGCKGKSAPLPVLEGEFNGEFIRYWNCPSLFIPKSITTWFKMYQYHKDFPGASMKSVDTQNARFLKAYYVYEGYVSEFKEAINKTKVK